MAKKSQASLNVLELIANENIVTRDVIDEIEDASLNYAIKTIVDRALPDVRDGLKPAQRRILYSMHHLGVYPDKPFVKSARITGDVAGWLHPHGSSYGVAVNMANEFTSRYPVIDPQGNFGFPLDGDGPAAERYTEMRLSKLGAEMLKDIDKKVVEFKPNYDEKDEEPIVLPSNIPYLLLNGATGIATGYTTEIPSHNINEVCDALIALVKDGTLTVKDLMKWVKGPDLPTGAYLIDSEQIAQLYETGKASLKFRAKIVSETNEDGAVQLIITDLPPDVKKGSGDSVGIVEKLYNLCVVEKKIPRVVDVRDESTTKKDKKTGKVENGVRIVIELHKTAVPDIVISELYKQTALEKTKGYLLRAVVNQSPVTLSLKDMMEHYLEHRKEVVVSGTQFDLEKANKRLHIVEGFKKIFIHLDDIIKVIRTSDDAEKELMKIYGLSQEQTKSILDLPLRRLSKMEEDKVDLEIKTLKEEIEKLNHILSNPSEVDEIIIKNLKELKSKHGDNRKTEVLVEGEITTSQFNADEKMVVVFTSKNNIKQISENSFDDMVKAGALRERQEVYLQGVRCTISSHFILLTEDGKCVKVNFSELIGDLGFLEGRKIFSIFAYDEEKDKNKKIIIMTKKGIVKKSLISAFKARNKRLAQYINLSEEDVVIGAKLIDEENTNTLVLTTNKGTVHRFYERSFSSTNLGGNGVPCISPAIIEDKEEIVNFDVVNELIENDKSIVLYIKDDSENFYIKNISVSEFKTKGRVSRGSTAINLKKNETIENIKVVGEDFFILDKKGVVHKQRFSSLNTQNKNHRPISINFNVMVVNFLNN